MRIGSCHRARTWSACLLVPVLLAGAASADNAAVGVIIGRVVDHTSGQPLRWVGVLIPGTSIGTMTNASGEFRLANLPPGTYPLKASIVGHTPRTLTGVQVDAGKTTTVQFVLVRSIDRQIAPIIVRRDPKEIEVGSSEQTHRGSGNLLNTLPVDDVKDLISIVAGVVEKDGEIHIQGAYARQTAILIDGVRVNDPLSGAALELGTLSLAEYEVITGGLDAEYGNASSVVNYTTRAGGTRFQGNLNYTTDDYGRADKTFTNYDRLSLGLGGPTPFTNLTFYVAGEGTFLDGEYVSAKSYTEHKALDDLVKVRDRAVAQYRGQARLDWKVNGGIRMSGEMTLDRGHDDPYQHNWNAVGYVSRVVTFAVMRPDGMRPGFFVLGNERLTLADGPWRQAAASAHYVDVSDQPDCIYCRLPISDNRSVAAVRVTGRGPSRALFVLADRPLFVGFQRPRSSWAPDLENAAADSGQSWFDAADHVPSTVSRSQQLKWTLTHTLSTRSFYEVRLSRLAFDATTSVDGKTPGEYASAGKLVWIPGHGPQPVGSIDFYTDPEVPFFATAYDQPQYSRRASRSWLVRADLTTRRWDAHHLKSGLQMQYDDLDQADIAFPGLQRQFRDPYGYNTNAFHAGVPEGSVYVQDRWDHEGMVVNAGLRYDFMSLGSGAAITLHNSEIPREVDRWKSQWSPRLGLAFPITDRDVFHFHYGRFIQFPSKSLLLSSQDPNAGTTLGNPNLQSETSVAFQAGIKHQWTRDLSSQIALFNKDLYGLVSSIEVTDDSTGVQQLRYVNRSYASSRGLELSVGKSLSHGWACDLAYTWAFADGVSSSADFGRQAQGLTHLPTGELPLDWDQRHTVNATLTFTRADDWSATALYSYGSGFPWTPVYRFEKKQDPLLENSRRFAATHTVNLLGQKYFRAHGQDLRLFFEGRNLLDETQVARIDPGLFPAPPDARLAYREYATETGKFGGAYLRDTDGDGRDEFYAVHDPNVFAQHRLFRVGLGIEF